MIQVSVLAFSSVPEGGKLCITAGEASMASGTCGLEIVTLWASSKRANFVADSLTNRK